MMANGVVEGKPIVWPGVPPPQGFPTTPQSTESGDGCEPVISLFGVERGLAIEPPDSTVAFSPSPSKQTCNVEPNKYLHSYATMLIRRR